MNKVGIWFGFIQYPLSNRICYFFYNSLRWKERIARNQFPPSYLRRGIVK